MFLKYYKLSVWFVVIGVLCLMPGDEFKEVKISIPHFDKVVHFGLFYILGLLVESVVNRNRILRVKWLLVAVFYAGIIEVIQANYIPMRNGDALDFLFDVFGLAGGFLSLKYYPKFARSLLG